MDVGSACSPLDVDGQFPTAGYKPWFKKANVEQSQPESVGYRDAVWHLCVTQTDGEAPLKQCLLDNG